MIFNASNAQIGGIQVSFWHQQEGALRALRLDLACLERLSVQSPAGLP